jgi:hypothetical protein
MANKTQLRVQQLTGSLVDLAYSGSQAAAGTAASQVSADLGGVLGKFAGAIGRIQGKTSDFTNQAEGVFNYTGADFNLDTNQDVNIDGATGINIGTAANVAVDFNASTLDIDASSAINIDGSSVDLDATGDITIDSSAGLFKAYSGAGAIMISGSVVQLDSGLGVLSIGGDLGGTGKPGGALNIDVSNSDGPTLTPADGKTLGFYVDDGAKAIMQIVDGGSSATDHEVRILEGSKLTFANAGGAAEYITGSNQDILITARGGVGLFNTGNGGKKMLLDSDSGININTKGTPSAIDVNSAAFDLDASAAITLDNSAGDISVDSAAGSVQIRAGEAAADAIVLDAEHASGGIDLSVASAVKVSLDTNSLDVSAGVQVNVDDTTASTSKTTGALVVDGGLGVGGDLYIGGEIVLTDGLDVSGLTTLRGDLQVLGTTTTVSSSNSEFADGLIGLNYSGTQTGPDRDIGLIMGRDSGNKAFFWDNTASMFMLGETSNDPDDAAVALSGGSDLGLSNIQLFGANGGGNYSKIQASGSSDAILIKHDNSELVFDAATITMSGTQLNGDLSEARSLWAINTIEGHTIQVGGGSRVQIGTATSGKLKVMGGVIEDSGGDARFGFADEGDVVIYDKDGAAALTVNGTSKLVTAAADLQVSGNDIADGNGDTVMTMSGDGQKKLTLAGPLAIPSNMSASFGGSKFIIKEDGSSGGQITVANGDLSLAADSSGKFVMDSGTGQLRLRKGGAERGSFVGGGSTDELKFLDGNGNQIIQFKGGDLNLSGSNINIVSSTVDSTAQDLSWKLPTGTNGLLFKSSNGDITYVNDGGVEVQGSNDGGRGYKIYNGESDGFSAMTAIGYYGSLSGSHIRAQTAENVGAGSYLSLAADDVTGSAGNSMQGGLFLSDAGFDVKTSTYSWGQGVLFASGSAQYDDFVDEFGANATILSALAAGAGGSATRDDTVIAAQVVAGGTTTLGSDCSAVPASSAGARVQVFVNGQLMMSGSSNDYTLTAYGASTNGVFKFDIEVDDVISVIAK